MSFPGSTYAGIRHGVDRLMNDPSYVPKVWFDRVILVLIMVSVGLLALDFTLAAEERMPPVLYTLDLAILWVFAVEYAMRLWVASPELPRHVRLPLRERIFYHVASRLNWMVKPYSLIDLAAILPLFPFLRSLRVLRVLRLLTHTRAMSRLFHYFNPFAAAERTLAANRLLFLFVAAFIVLTVFLGGATAYLAEHHVNDKFAQPFDAIYWASVTLTTVGFGDITPVTTGGRVVAMVVMFAGFFLLALTAGAVSQTFVPALLNIREEGIRMTTLVNHLVLCGWNRHTPMLLREIRAQDPALAARVVVFSDCEPPADLPAWVTFVKGDPTQETELAKVRLEVAEAVLVVAEEPPDATFSDRDARTLLTVFTARAYEAKLGARGVQRTRPLHITAELLDPDNIGFFRTAGADEVIETARSGSALLAHSAARPEAGELLATLVAEEGAYLQRRALPVGMVLPMTFWELATAVKQGSEQLPLGIERAGRVTFNPPAGFSVEPGDVLVYLGAARSRPATAGESFWDRLRGPDR